jgi:hypothetical protein
MLDSFANGQVSRAHTIDINLRSGETFHLSCLSDLHVDSSSCDLDGLKRLAEERRKLPNHAVIAIGDICDLVMPPDLKRYRPTARSRKLDGRDDFLSAAIDMVVTELKDLKLNWHLVSPGNHEDDAMRHHGVDATSIIAHALKARRGGYWGILSYNIHMGNRNSSGRYHTACFRVAYHHGAWGGQLAKGYIGAQRFANCIEGWDVFLYGHCHHARLDNEIRINAEPKSKELREREVYLINCSSWTEPFSRDPRYPSYKERAGYPISSPRKCPLIRVTPRWAKTEHSNGGMKLDVKVEM